MLKKMAVCGVLLAVSGCASQNAGMGVNQLEADSYLRAQRDLPLDLVNTQRAIFKQQAQCGSDLQFAVDQDHPSYARVTKPFRPGATGWGDTIVMGVTLMSDLTIRTRVYSYYAPTKGQIQEMYNALSHPEICPGELIPEKSTEVE